jgi:uncharacterized protein (TIGR02757 family)
MPGNKGVEIDRTAGKGMAGATASPLIYKDKLDALYDKYNRREYVHPDPLEFLHGYDDPVDREIVGLIASSLAYGKITRILRSVSSILGMMQPSPSQFLSNATKKSLSSTFSGFRHRFTTGDDIADLLYGAKSAIDEYGSLHDCFMPGMTVDDETIIPALKSFVAKLSRGAGGCRLLPCPSRGSACKRLNLFLRWMVRRDDVDPGGWYNVPASRLIIPLDTHIYGICLALGLTKRKQADLRTAMEITAAFREIAPDDPVRYDFALARLGIRKDADATAFLDECGAGEAIRGA